MPAIAGFDYLREVVKGHAGSQDLTSIIGAFLVQNSPHRNISQYQWCENCDADFSFDERFESR